MKLKKVLGALVASGLLVFAMGALAGCADNSKQVITDSLNEEINQIKSMDSEAIGDLSAVLPESTLHKLGISSEEFMSAVFAGFDGTVDSVEVDGKTAQAVVTFTSKNLSDIEEKMESISDEMQNDPEQFAGMSTDEIYAWTGEKIMEYINAAPVETREPVTIDYELNGNTWEPTADSQTKLESALFG